MRDSKELEQEIAVAEKALEAANEAARVAQEAADKVQEEARAKLKHAEEIKHKKQKVIDEQRKGHDKREKVKEFCEKLNAKSPGNFKVILTKVEEKESVVEYHYGDSQENEIIWEHEYEVPSARIQYIPEPSIYVDVRRHEVYKRYNSNPSYWAMFLNYKYVKDGPRYFDYRMQDRAYKNPKTVITKIEEAIESISYTKRRVTARALALTAAELELKDNYPECEVEIKRQWKRYNYGRNGDGREVDSAIVKLPNKVIIEFEILSSSETVFVLERVGVKFPILHKDIASKDHVALLEAYMKLKFKK